MSSPLLCSCTSQHRQEISKGEEFQPLGLTILLSRTEFLPEAPSVPGVGCLEVTDNDGDDQDHVTETKVTVLHSLSSRLVS